MLGLVDLEHYQPDLGMSLNPHEKLPPLGKDLDGRDIVMTRRMAAAFKMVVLELGWQPTIVQGAFMAVVGGAAKDSGHVHDGAGALDIFAKDVAASRVKKMIRAARKVGWGAWLRDKEHGNFDYTHLHWVLIGETVGAHSSTIAQMDNYLAGGDGFGNEDYHPRPQPIPVFDYAAYVAEVENDLRLDDEVPGTGGLLVQDLLKSVVRFERVLANFREGERRRYVQMKTQIEALRLAVEERPDDDPFTQAEARAMIADLGGELADILRRKDPFLAPPLGQSG